MEEVALGRIDSPLGFGKQREVFNPKKRPAVSGANPAQWR